MDQYISKDALKAEIKKLSQKAKELYGYSQFNTAYDNVLSILDTLEVKEVDLEKELDYDDYMTFFKEHPEYSNGDWGFEETWVFAQYCYKLGLKAQKGE